MKQEAVEKLKNEIEANPNNPYVSYVGTTLIGHIEINKDFAEHVLKKDKTILGSLKAMEEEARKIKNGNMAMITPDQGFVIIFNYFIDTDPKDPSNEKAQEQPEDTAEEESTELKSSDQKPEVETFSRNSWFENPKTGEILAFKVGDEKPTNIKELKRSSKKEYDAYIAIQKEEAVIAEDYDDDLGDLW